MDESKRVSQNSLKGYSAHMDNTTNEVAVPGINRPQATSSAPPTASRRGAFRQWLYRFIKMVYFERIALIHPDCLPRTGPVLYLGLHRNGAVDGFVYDQVLPQGATPQAASRRLASRPG